VRACIGEDDFQISNASDAIEKVRYLSMSGKLATDREMKISVDTDKVRKF